jgi:hypothetical protein
MRNHIGRARGEIHDLLTEPTDFSQYEVPAIVLIGMVTSVTSISSRCTATLSS